MRSARRRLDQRDAQLMPGDVIGVRGPFGHGFPNCDGCAAKTCSLPRVDLGLPPLRSLINQVLDERGAFGRVIILYGTNHPSEMLFKEELGEWAARDDVEFHMTVDRAERRLDRERRRDYHVVSQDHDQPAQHRGRHRWSADHVSLCIDGTAGQGYSRDRRSIYLWSAA